MSAAPEGTVTLLFSDIEGSTRLLQAVGDAYSDLLLTHRRLLREAFSAHDGYEVDTGGDSFFVAFADARQAVAAARQAQEALAGHAWPERGAIRVRMGLHTGEPRFLDGNYLGIDVHKAARIAAAGHGGQVLLSSETRNLVSVSVRDLGEHRVKDFAGPVWIFQLGRERFPPLKTISNTNLPRPASTFVGREREVEEVLAVLREGARFLTLSGPGGSGKTRLAIEVAADLVAECRSGVFWVGLAPLREPGLVVDAIAQALGAKDDLAEHIGEREMLLVIDNFEQVVDAAPDLAATVEHCPNLKLLVTSRERLRVRGEVEYPVLPLAEPDAVDLFCARARLESDASVVELCKRLDYLPLAVELAAARTNILTPRLILDRLAQRLDLLVGGRDAEARQKTLRATIAWSYELLDDRERQLFARLAVFVGGFTLEAANEVAGAGLDTLESLVDKSLLRHTHGRFWMLETIRDYAVEQLESSAAAGVLRRRHGEYFFALARRAQPHLREESTEWLDRLEREHDNLRAGLDGFENFGDGDLVVEFTASVWRFWSLRGHLVEGRRRLERALIGEHGQAVSRANALLGAADLALDIGDRVAAAHRGEEALALYRALGDQWSIASCILMLGVVEAFDGEWPQAQLRFAESLRLFSELGDEHQSLQATRRLAWSYEELGDREHARVLYGAMLRRARATGDPFIEAKCLGVLAQSAAEEGQLDRAVTMLEEAHHIHRERSGHPDRYGDALVVCRLAHILVAKGNAAVAARLLSCFEALIEDIGVGSIEGWVTTMNDATLVAIRDQLDDASTDAAWKQGRTLAADEAVILARRSLD
jgi:predicted ATPase/class 3 adenylate cyclase